jgi:hypothetical protein
MRIKSLAVALVLLSALTACARSDSDEATATFIACLERNGVEAQDVRVTVDRAGKVEGIEAVIVSEGEVPYEPVVRMACTQEVEES